MLNGQVGSIAGKEANHKVTAVTDAASSMILAARAADNLDDHARCICHILNRCVEKAFELTETVSAIVLKCKGLAKATHKSANSCALIKSYCERQNPEVPYVKIIQPVRTRWNSMAMCMTSVLQLRRPLSDLKDREDRSESFKEKLIKATPTKTQFEVLEALTPILNTIKTLSERLSSDKLPSNHLIISSLVQLNRLTATNPTAKTFLKNFKKEMQKRVPNCGRQEESWCIASFFHPRYKGSILYCKPEDIEKGQQLVNKKKDKGAKKKSSKTVAAGAGSGASSGASGGYLTRSKTAATGPALDESTDDDIEVESEDEDIPSFAGTTFVPDIFETTKARVVQMLQQSKEYRDFAHPVDPDVEAEKTKSASRTSSKANLDEALSASQWSEVASFLEEGLLSDFGNPTDPPADVDTAKAQVEYYINKLPRMENPDGDALAYWRTHGSMVPDLARCARSVLNIPASSSSSERVFSTGGRTITAFRTKLSAVRAEQLICINSNYQQIQNEIKTWDLGLPKRERKRGAESGTTREGSPTPGSGPGTSSSRRAMTPTPGTSGAAALPDIDDGSDDGRASDFDFSDVSLDLPDSDIEYGE